MPVNPIIRHPRPTRAEIDLAALRYNFAVVRQLAGSSSIMAVVKAEAYGHGMIRMAEEFVRLGTDWLGVSFLEEGIALRQAGIELPILVLGGLVDEQIEDYIDSDLTPTVSSVWKAQHVETVASKRKTKLAVHLKVDTGMGRVGQSWKTAGLLFRELAKLPHLIPEGLYTHFASAESNDLGYSRLQLDRFNQVLETARKLGLDFRFAHAANSGALLQMGDEASYNMVRPGIALYGLTPSEHLNDRFDLKPVMSLLTRVVFVKRPPAGTPVGYGSTWKSPGNRWIATLPIGYGDGFPRRAGNRANVVLRGRLCPIVGNVSMDQTTIDAGVEAYLDDEVVIFGSSSTQTNSIWRLCLAIDAIPYEILCGLTARVPRVYVD